MFSPPALPQETVGRFVKVGTPGDGVKSADGEPMRLVEAATLCADERAVTETEADVGEDHEAMR